MICIDLMHEWLWHVRVKVTGAEYGICLATFILIQFLGVEYGIIVGAILYVLCRKLGLDVGEPKRGDPSASEKNTPLTNAHRQRKPGYGSTEILSGSDNKSLNIQEGLPDKTVLV